MAKLVAVVGSKHSGKTTIIENVTRQLTSRCYHVGTIKEMVHIPTLDTPETETDRYAVAGAETVVAVPRNETVIFIKKRLALNEALSYLFGLDYVLVEGFESEKTLPRIVAAKTTDEIAQYSEDLAIAISGLITDSPTQTTTPQGVPFINAINQAKKLADLVEQKAFEKLPNLSHCGECGYSTCYDLAKAMVKGDQTVQGCTLPKKEHMILEVNGMRVPLKEFPEQIIQSTLEGMLLSLGTVLPVKSLRLEIKKDS
jgi:molybdopterin-guanine dinucleotide biosynthesis protein B